jgi:hypothetical protein
LSYSKELDVVNIKGIRVLPIVLVWCFAWVLIGICLAPFDAAATCWEYATVPLASYLCKAIGWFIIRLSEQSGLEL